MKAAVRSKYGGPENLTVMEMDKPVPGENEILVRVHAATVNRTDCGILWGKPFVIKFFTGLPNPKSPVPGTDFAGVVEEVGNKVKDFKPGDKIYGFDDNGLASHAEYLKIEEDKPISVMPDNLSFEEAAASLEGAHYAYNFINKVKLRPGNKVLVNGASGAIGSAAVQMLRHYQVDVTAVVNTINIDMIRNLGAEKIFDYEVEDSTKDKERYEFVFDAVGKSTFGRCKTLLKDGGVYISSELGPGGQNPFLALMAPFMKDKKVKFPLPVNIKGSIKFIKELTESGEFRPVIDRIYKLEEIAEAYNYVNSGRKTGNVIIKMAE